MIEKIMIHQNRRKELLSRLDDNAVVIISTNPEQLRSGDVHFAFRPHSNFYYLTGFDEPETFVVFSQNNHSIFLRGKDQAREIWDGERLSVDDAPKTLNMDNAYSIKQLKELSTLIAPNSVIYFDKNPTALDKEITAALSGHKLHSCADILHEMRLIKDDHEIKTMQKAADISIGAHQMAMQNIRPGMFEFEVQSLFDGCFGKNNVQHAYTPIVAGGNNGCILHYIKNNEHLHDGDLVLIDAGCELDCYASDITRTFPINGKFSDTQKKIYQIVLDAQIAAIHSIKPGVGVYEPHKIASDIIRQGLIGLDILTTDGDLSQFYMHGTGHWLGLDVHDVGQYKNNDVPRVFEPGMIITVEPGIYLRKSDKINSIYHDIGIRIEDDVLVTESGNTVLTKSLAKTIDEIESLMKH